MHVLLDDDRGRLTLRRLWPWQRVLVLLEPGPVPVAGVAMVTELLADGAGPLYRDVATDDLAALAARAAAALTW